MGKKNKVILPPELPPDIPEDEFEVSDEDLAFVQENPAYTGFLTNLDTKSIDKHVVRVADAKEDELEALYEKRNRKAALRKGNEEGVGLQVDRVDALPIKTLEGELRYRTAKESSVPENKVHGKEPGKNDDNKGVTKLTKAERRQLLKKTKKEAKKQGKEEPKVDVTKGPLHSEVLAKVEKELSVEELFIKKKIRLAEAGMSLLENPESNIKSLKEMLQFCDDEDPNVVKLGLLSLLAVFKDIIPGYRIRLPTEKELQMAVSKDVKRTRFYESTLLRSYKTYLLKLTDFEKRPSFHHVAVQCLCSLLEAVPHFNFRESLLASVVKNISSTDDVVRKVCCDAVKSLFVNEGKHGGEVTLEAVRLIANHVKINDCQLHPDTIEVFLSLVFDEDLGKFERTEDKKSKPKKMKKRDRRKDPDQAIVNEHKKARQELMAKTREEVNADFKAVSFAPDAKERLRMQTETLSAVFETYFRVLKQSLEAPSRSEINNASLSSGGHGAHPLLGPCLNGLGKFSHLIDLDFMGDLMECLKKLSGYNDHHDGFYLQNSLSVSERLQCCIVAFRVMRNNLDALNVDLHDFFVQLYNLLLEYRPDRDKGEVLAEALKTLLWEGKQHDMQRAAAFIKRLATFSLCYGSAESMAALITVKHLLQKNSKCRNLLENDAGGGSLSGLVVKYQADAKDPNLSGALASVLWELSLLAKHYHPTVSSMASSISSMGNYNATQNQVFLSTASPLQGFTDLSVERQLFNIKPTGKSASFSCKRKRGRDFVSMSHGKVENLDTMVDEGEVKRKLEDHFTVLRDIAENELLRGDMNHTLASIQLYEEYKCHEKQDRKKINKKSKVRKDL